MTSDRTTPGGSHPYLRAATAGIRRHTGTLTDDPAEPATSASQSADRVHLDVLHTHLTALHQFLDELADAARPPHPAAGRHLAAAHTRLWQASTEVHHAFHTLPRPDGAPSARAEGCHPEHPLEGPPVLTICQRHLAASHTVRRKTTPTDLKTPPPSQLREPR